ncbi:MAG: YwaF family protein, partial [Clostridia bacterium]
MRAVQVLVWAAIGISLCRRVRKSPQSAKKIARITAGWLLFLIFLQCAMAVRGGYASLQTLLPLHLCSAIAVLTVPMMIRWDVRFFPLSWYLGMPGALLALCVPVYGFSPWPHLAQAVFTATHATLVFAPLLMRCAGVQPTRLSAWYAFAAGNGLLVLAEITNG